MVRYIYIYYMDALPAVLIESLLGHMHAAALARAQQVNHSFWALARAVAAFIVQSRNVAHMLRHSETHIQLLRRLELRPSSMVRDTTWIDFCTAEGNIREVREELIQWCGVMVTPRSGERGSNLKRARHASLSGKVYLLVAQNMHGGWTCDNQGARGPAAQHSPRLVVDGWWGSN